MFTRKFWLDAGDTFLVALVAVAIVDVEALIAVGSLEQAGVVGASIARAGLIAGVRAVAPRFIALRNRSEA